MAKNKISEWSATAANNTDVGGIDIAEGCAPSGINNAIRELMAQVKDQQTGTDADNFTVGGNLSVSGTTTATGLITANGGVIGALDGSLGATTPSTIVATTLTTTGNTILGNASTDTLNVGNGGLIKDASGNVGVGITPSAWSSNYKALQINAVGSLSSDTETVFLGNNIYWDGTNDRYLTSNFGSSYLQNHGVHKWNIAASGTAGNVATFTQAMTLDASGNLGIGTSSPTATLDVNGTIKGDLSPSFTSTNQSLTATGYQKLPGGLIMQWGSIAIPSSSAVTVTYPIAFPNSTLNIQLTIATSGTYDYYAPKIESTSTTQLVIRNTTGVANTTQWFAIGY